MNKVPGWVFRYVGNKTFDFSSKKKDFLPKNDQIWPKIGIFGQFGPGHAGLFGALLVGWLVVVARGLYLARHLFTLSLPQKHRICLLTQPEVVTMAKKFVTTLKGCNNGKIKLLQCLQVVTMAN